MAELDAVESRPNAPLGWRLVHAVPLRHGVAVTDNDSAESAGRAWLRRVGKRVRLIRLTAELTQDELGAAADVSRSFISLIERGSDVSALRLWRLADALHVPILQLLTDEDGIGDERERRTTSATSSHGCPDAPVTARFGPA